MDREAAKTDQHKSTIWLIRGAPGVGKSAVGRRIKKTLSNSAVIEVDSLRLMRADPQWRGQKSHRLGLRQSARIANSFLSNGFDPVVIIDTLASAELDYLKRYLDTEPWVITLVASLMVLMRRARNRETGFNDDRTTVNLNDQFVAEGKKRGNVIDSSNMNADEVLEQILEMAEIKTSRENPPDGAELAKHSLPRTTCGSLLLIRHAKPDYSVQGPYAIAPGPPLSTEGVRQAERLRSFLENRDIDRFVCSPFHRAVQTAEIVADGRFSIEENEVWGEIGPGERLREVQRRVKGWLASNMPEDGKTTVIIGHGATIKTALQMVACYPPRGVVEDKHGNPLAQGDAWILTWEHGRLLASEPAGMLLIKRLRFEDRPWRRKCLPKKSLS